MWPSSTSITAFRSSSVIQGRAKGIIRRSDIVDLHAFRGGQRVVCSEAGTDNIKLMLGLVTRVDALEDRANEAGDQISLGGRNRSKIQLAGRNSRVSTGIQSWPHIIINKCAPGPEDSQDMLVAVDATEIRRDAADQA